MRKPEQNEITWSPETTFLIVFLLILVPLLITGFLAQ